MSDFDFDLFREIIDAAIEKLIISESGITTGQNIKNIQYQPVWTLSESRKKKLAYINIKKKGDKKYRKIDIDKIESTGASWEEIVEYLQRHNVKKKPAKLGKG